MARAQEGEQARPNVLLIVADDMGYGDMGCTGSQVIATPHLDALAASGVLCERAYVASPVCSPSRAGLITGRDPRRFGYQDNLNAASSRYATRPELLGLPVEEHTLGDHLGAAGYATGLVGKWHLGTDPVFHPNARGFEHFCGMLNGSHGYFVEAGKKHRIERNGEILAAFSSAYLTDFFTDEAERFVRAQEGAPWLLMLSYNAPHTPMHATKQDLAACAHIVDPERRTYAAMMRALDRGVGRMISLLGELGVADDTLVVFLSDNGGATNNASWNGPLSGCKGSLKEGGVRVPLIVSWPGHIPAGVRTDLLVSSLDLLPTFLVAAGADPLPPKDPPSHLDARNLKRHEKLFGTLDGVNLLPRLSQDGPKRGPLFWRLQGQAGVMMGGYKLLRPMHRPAQLFRIDIDPGETTDLMATEPQQVAVMFGALAQWERTLPTVPLWGSSPFWSGQSATIYDGWPVRPEPK